MTRVIVPSFLKFCCPGLASLLMAAAGCSGHAMTEPGVTSTENPVSGSTLVSGIGSRCLDDNGDGTANGNKIQIWVCNGTAAQSWAYTNETFVGPGGKCLDIKEDDQVVGATVQLYTCNGTNAQKWTLDSTAIKSSSGLCLTVQGGINANGTAVELDECDGSSSQTWNASASSPVPPTPPANSKSIKEYVTCDGTTDDSLGAAKALAAAKNSAFTLLVDCPVLIHIDTDYTRSIFIDSGTSVYFEGAGKFIVDNVLVPAFAILSSSNITLTNWNVEYTGIMPISSPIGSGPGGLWNDIAATEWLEVNRGVKGAHSLWQGYVNSSALFFIGGDSSNVTMSGLTATAYSVTEGYRFIPAVVAIAPDWKNNQTLTSTTVATAANTAGPSNLTFDHITLDGTIMGWVGSGLSDSVFSNITSKHFSDLQDADGNNSGGIGKWFAPPHLFYLNQSSILGNNTNLTFTNIVDAPSAITATDNGDRVGVARDVPGDSGSGVVYSLKLACSNCTVNNYQSNRADGFMDALQLENTTIENVSASFNSEFTHGIYPGVRFPEAYAGLTYTNMTITDVAAVSQNQPIGSSGGTSDLLFKNVNLYMTSLKAGLTPYATNADQEASSLRTYTITNPAEVIEVGPNGKL